MPIFRTLILAALMVSTVTTVASAEPKETCASIVTHLGYPVDDYHFQESGLFSMEQHQFGTLTCYINISDAFDSLYRGEMPIAEDGYFGTSALVERDRLITEFNTVVTVARNLRQAEIEVARNKFRQTEGTLTQEREATLEALRVSSEPPSKGQDSASTDSVIVTKDEPLAEAADIQDAGEKSPILENHAGYEANQMYVVVDRLTRRTCPSSACGTVGTLMYREAVEVLEERQGWGRITRTYDASCINGSSKYVDSGDARCNTENGVVDGEFAEWVSLNYLESERPVDPAESAATDERLVAQSDDFRIYHAEFAEAARELIEQERCSESDFVEMGGWASSPSKGDGIYFMYCGGFSIDNRLYLDVSTGEISW